MLNINVPAVVLGERVVEIILASVTTQMDDEEVLESAFRALNFVPLVKGMLQQREPKILYSFAYRQL